MSYIHGTDANIYFYNGKDRERIHAPQFRYVVSRDSMAVFGYRSKKLIVVVLPNYKYTIIYFGETNE